MVEAGTRHDRTPLPKRELLSYKETTLREVGIDAANDQKLGLADEPFTLATFSTGKAGETVIVGRLNHPLAGKHLIDFLNILSPYPMSLGGINDDNEMPQEARHAQRQIEAGIEPSYQLKANLGLYDRHTASPTIKPAFDEYVRDHLGNWIRAQNNLSGDLLFRRLDHMQVIHGTAYLGYIADNKLRSLEKSANGDPDRINTHVSFLKSVLAHPLGDRLRALLNTEPEYRTSRRKTDGKYYVPHSFGGATIIDSKRLATHLLTLLSELSPEERQAFMLYETLCSTPRTLVDIDTGSVLSDFRNPKTEFTDPTMLSILDHNGNSIQVRIVPPDDLFGAKKYERITKYAFSPSYIRDSVVPGIVYKVSPAGREFLTQREARSYLGQLSADGESKPDVIAGRVLLAFASPPILDELKRIAPRMKLNEEDDYAQRIGPVQIPVWVSVREHADLLLGNGENPPNPFIEALEQAA